MVTVASPGVPRVTPVGSEDGSIVSIKFSSFSTIKSSLIEILNIAMDCPAGNVTVYGPE